MEETFIEKCVRLGIDRAKAEQLDSLINRVKKADCRYEKVRKLNPREFENVYRESIATGVPFDELVDRL